MIFKGYCNGKTIKHECAAFDRNLVTEIQIPVTKNGAILCGKYAPDRCLVVVDFDVVKRQTPNLEDVYKWLGSKTFIVKTGSGGLHLYFWVSDAMVRCKAYLEKDKRTGKLTNFQFTDQAKKFNLVEVDVRAEGNDWPGIIFAPGCKFKDHNYNPYLIIDDSPIRVITENEYISYINSLVQEKKSIENEIPSLKVNMRRGFQDILLGKFLITHVIQSETNQPEFLYWAGFWREYLNCGGELNDGIRALQKTQPEFDAETTQQQLKYLQEAGKRPSREFYGKLFPQYEKETEEYYRSEDSNTEFLNKILLLLDKHTDRIKNMENNIEELKNGRNKRETKRTNRKKRE